MKIPGLTFIFVPIICWFIYVNSNAIINSYRERPGEFIAVFITLYGLATLIELLVFRRDYDTITEAGDNAILLLPFTLLYKLLIFINKHLTITI